MKRSAASRELNVVDMPPTTPALMTCSLLGMVSAAVLIAGLVATLPDWIYVAALASLIAGLVLTGVVAFKLAISRGHSFGCVIASTLCAPIRFFFDWTV